MYFPFKIKTYSPVTSNVYSAPTCRTIGPLPLFLHLRKHVVADNPQLRLFQGQPRTFRPQFFLSPSGRRISRDTPLVPPGPANIPFISQDRGDRTRRPVRRPGSTALRRWHAVRIQLRRDCF